MFSFPMTVYMLWRSVSISSKISCPLASVVRGVVHHPFTIRDASSFVPSISNLCLPPHFPHQSERSLLTLVISPMDKVLLHQHFLLASLSSCSFMTVLLACSSSWELGALSTSTFTYWNLSHQSDSLFIFYMTTPPSDSFCADSTCASSGSSVSPSASVYSANPTQCSLSSWCYSLRLQKQTLALLPQALSMPSPLLPCSSLLSSKQL